MGNFPEGVSMLIGMFEVLFGTSQGEALRSWCVAQGWPLVWAHNPTTSLWNCGPSTTNCTFPVPNFYTEQDAANERLLDPVVLRQVAKGYNITKSAGFRAAKKAFETHWKQVASHQQPRSDVLWKQLVKVGAAEADNSSFVPSPLA